MLSSITKQKKTRFKLKLTSQAIALVALVLVFSFGVLPKVYALTQSELRERSRQLQSEINANNAKVEEYRRQATTLQGKLNQLNSEIASVNAQIAQTSLRIEQLKADLEKAQAELERQKGLLKASMRALYKKGGASTVELLVASDSFSEFINDQEYLERLKGAIQDSTNRVIQLKQQIQDQQKEQENLLVQQQDQRNTLAAKQAEQRALLDFTKGEQSRYQAAVDDLRSQQAAINAQLAPASGVDYTQQTSYPWANISPWNFNSCYVDPWGMCKRHCVSYTAWKVAQSGRDMPYWGGRGDANEWDNNARAAGIPVDGNPRAGDVAISNAGFYGHAMYVEAVLPDGRIRVSQFNYESRGLYSEMTISRGSLVFIHFP